MQQTIKEKTDATLVAGVDNFNNFILKDAPTTLLDPDDIQSVKRNIVLKKGFLMAGVPE